MVWFPAAAAVSWFPLARRSIQPQPGDWYKRAAGRRPDGGGCPRRAGAEGLPCKDGSSRKTLELHMNRLYCIAMTLAVGLTASGAFAQGTPAGAAAAPAAGAPGRPAATAAPATTTTAPAATTTTAPAATTTTTTTTPPATTTDKAGDGKKKSASG